jgi:hypothetical protein
MPDTPQAKDLAVKFAFEGKLPGEEALVACINYATVVRQTMDPAICKEFDALNLKIAKGFWGLFGIE